MKRQISRFFGSHGVDKSSPIPLHYQLRTIILEGIKKGELIPGDCLPTEIDFSKNFSISRTTVRQALSSLGNDGYLYRIKSKGTFLAEPKIDLHYMTGIESFDSQIKESGREPTTRILQKSVEKCTPEIAALMAIKANDQIIKIIRLRYADAVPVVVVESYHPLQICGQLLERDLEHMSLLAVLAEKAESKVVRVKRVIEAIGASESDSELLEVKIGSPIQFFKNTSYSKNGKVVEYSFAKYRGDKYIFSVDIKSK